MAVPLSDAQFSAFLPPVTRVARSFGVNGCAASLVGYPCGVLSFLSHRTNHMVPLPSASAVREGFPFLVAIVGVFVRMLHDSVN